MKKLLQKSFIALMAMMCMPVVLRAQEDTGEPKITGVYLTVRTVVDGKTYTQDYTEGAVYVAPSQSPYVCELFVTVKGENLDKCNGNQYVFLVGGSNLANNSNWALIDNNTMRMEYYTSWFKGQTLERCKVGYSNNGNNSNHIIYTDLYVVHHEHGGEGSDTYVNIGDAHQHEVKTACHNCPVLGGYTTAKGEREDHTFSNGVCTLCGYECQHPGITTNPLKFSVGNRSAHYYGSDVADNLFDGKTSTKWCSLFEGKSTYVEFQYMRATEYSDQPYPKRLLSYTLVTADDVEVIDAEETYVNRNWQAWTIWGKQNANDSWEVVDKVEYALLPEKNSTESAPFYIDTDKPYAYYKITVDKIRGGKKQMMSAINLNFDVLDNNCSVCDAQYPDHTGTDKEIAFAHGSTYDVTQLFTKDANVGDATYRLIQGGTGEGVLNGTQLTVNKVGTFRIMMSTEATGKYLADCAIAKLTVNKAELANSPGFVAPTPKEDMIFIIDYRDIINAGSVDAEYGELFYALGAADGSMPTEWKTAETLPNVYSTPGTYYAWYKATGKGNYKDIEPVRLECVINKREVIITAKAHTITYGDEPANNGFTSKGFLKVENRDEPYFGSDESMMKHIEYYYDYEKGDAVGEYNIYIRTKINEKLESKRILGNYEPTYVAGKLTVQPLNLNYNYRNFLNLPNNNKVYNGEPQSLGITVLKEDFIEGRDYYISYKRNGVDTDDLTSAGAIEVRVSGMGNYTSSIATIITIKKADPIVTAPTPRSLMYSGDPQVLVDAGSTTGGTMQYSLDGEHWSEELPQAIGNVDKAQTYTVYYKAIGDNNHNESGTASITVTINVCSHYGGTATCAERAVCDHCHMLYGQLNPNNHNYAEDGICADCDKVNPEAEHVHFVEGNHSKILVAEDIENVGVSYTRNFRNTNWQALYVPFALAYEDLKADFDVAYINDVHQFDDDDNGAIDRTEVEAIKIKGGMLEANFPYMIRAKSTGEKTIAVENATIHATVANSIDCSSVYRSYTFTGSYNELTSNELPQNEGYYALSGGKWAPIAEGTALGAFRVYLKIENRDGSSIYAKAIQMRVVGDATSIEGMETSDQKSVIYDLQGRRVENPAKGIYIINGKKVIL